MAGQGKNRMEALHKMEDSLTTPVIQESNTFQKLCMDTLQSYRFRCLEQRIPQTAQLKVTV